VIRSGYKAGASAVGIRGRGLCGPCPPHQGRCPWTHLRNNNRKCIESSGEGRGLYAPRAGRQHAACRMHGIRENEKTPDEKASFLCRRFFTFSFCPWRKKESVLRSGSFVQLVEPAEKGTAVLMRGSICRAPLVPHLPHARKPIETSPSQIVKMGPGALPLVGGLGAQSHRNLSVKRRTPARSPRSTRTQADWNKSKSNREVGVQGNHSPARRRPFLSSPAQARRRKEMRKRRKQPTNARTSWPGVPSRSFSIEGTSSSVIPSRSTTDRVISAIYLSKPPANHPA